jgi:hypothetical protein
MPRNENETPRWLIVLIVIIVAGLLIWTAVPKHLIYIGIGIAVVIIGLTSWLVYRKRGIAPLKNFARKSYEWLKGTGEAQGTKRKPARTPIPEETREYVFKRAHYRCQYDQGRCGKTENLDIHHINRDRTNHNINNLILLCPEHHDKADNGNYRIVQLKGWARYPGIPKDYSKRYRRHR